MNTEKYEVPPAVVESGWALRLIHRDSDGHEWARSLSCFSQRKSEVWRRMIESHQRYARTLGQREPTGAEVKRMLRRDCQARVVTALVTEAPHDRLAANVYADWLEENGQHQAAAMLRAAFPVDDGTGDQT